MNGIQLLRVSLLTLFALLIVMSFGLLSYQISITLENQSFENTQPLIFLGLLFVFSLIAFSFIKAWNNIFVVFAKLFSIITGISFTIFVILFVIHSNTEDITQSIQPSIDTIIIEFIESEKDSSRELEILNSIISQPHTIEHLYVKNISEQQAEKLTNNLNIETQDTLQTSKLLLSYGYETLEEQNLQNTPLPLSFIKEEVEEFNSIDPQLFSIFYSINQNAELYILYPTNSTNSTNPLSKLREECQDIPENMVCEPISKTSYNTLINETKPLTNSTSLITFNQINNLENLEETIEEKTDIWKIFLLTTIIGIGLAVASKYLDTMINKKEISIIEISSSISSKLALSILLPTIGLGILLYIFDPQKIQSIFESIIKTLTQESISIPIGTLPLYEIVNKIITTSFVILSVTISCLFLIFIGCYIFKKVNKHKETKINHF